MTGDLAIVGEAPGPSDEFPTGRTWLRLAELAGLGDPRQIEEHLARPAALLGFWPGKEGKGSAAPPATLRAAAAAFPPGLRVLALGRRVAAAFGADPKAAYLEWLEVGGRAIAVIPYPSAINRWFNADGNRARAEIFLRGLVQGTPPRTLPPPPLVRTRLDDQPLIVGRSNLERQPGESDAAWLALRTYLELGPRRTYRRACEALGKPEGYVKQMKRWGGPWQWAERARQYDSAELEAAIHSRAHLREAARQAVFDAAPEAAGVLRDIIEGRLDLGALDDKGKPLIAPSTRSQAAQVLLGLAGLSQAKRAELILRQETSSEEARRAAEEMDLDELRRLVRGTAPEPTKH